MTALYNEIDPAAADVLRQCTSCGAVKHTSLFSPHQGARGGIRPECKSCRADAARSWRRQNAGKASHIRWSGVLRRQFSMTPSDYDALFKAQNGVCAICERPQRVHGRKLCVDHCHSSGLVRGLLCHSCNTGLGKIGDTAEAVAKALAYVTGRKINPQLASHVLGALMDSLDSHRVTA